MNFLTVSFSVHIEENHHYKKDGDDVVTFYLSVNPGEEEKPLCKIASGGEKSRILLGIRSLLASKQTFPRKTLVFDEIDQGISGETAARIARLLKKMAKTYQVIVISHLPQMIAVSDHHYRIQKVVEGNATVTHIEKLNEEESEKECARLLSSGVITETARRAARALREELAGGKL